MSTHFFRFLTAVSSRWPWSHHVIRISWTRCQRSPAAHEARAEFKSVGSACVHEEENHSADGSCTTEWCWLITRWHDTTPWLVLEDIPRTSDHAVALCLTVVPEEPPADHVVVNYQKVVLEERAVHKRRHQRTENMEKTSATSASGGKKPTRTGWTGRAQQLTLGSNTCEEKTKAGEHAK